MLSSAIRVTEYSFLISSLPYSPSSFCLFSSRLKNLSTSRFISSLPDISQPRQQKLVSMPTASLLSSNNPIYPSLPAIITGLSAAIASRAARLTPTNNLHGAISLFISVLAPVSTMTSRPNFWFTLSAIVFTLL